jgi:hypothetical protein
VANVVPALTALYGSVDELKHRERVALRSRARSDRQKRVQFAHMRLSTTPLDRAMKKFAARKIFLIVAISGQQFPSVAKLARM